MTLHAAVGQERRGPTQHGKLTHRFIGMDIARNLAQLPALEMMADGEDDRDILAAERTDRCTVERQERIEIVLDCAENAHFYCSFTFERSAVQQAFRKDSRVNNYAYRFWPRALPMKRKGNSTTKEVRFAGRFRRFGAKDA
ncbi:hypothetical protein [Bifidobacterium sp. ESL0800]|uniref:hypothetical protein n=1 Tax=Bifidobacterium sp. ESL0800 TaxID=2983236 RepID=UPI0023F64387|nr:hypothetical protein [Bifidobacterium sp. ESL0800]WEV76163.1 hypothetical protein OZX75_02960 [Bifidobacterium sp. ESL0800]